MEQKWLLRSSDGERTIAKWVEPCGDAGYSIKTASYLAKTAS